MNTMFLEATPSGVAKKKSVKMIEKAYLIKPKVAHPSGCEMIWKENDENNVPTFLNYNKLAGR